MTVMAALTAIEAVWWALNWQMGNAPVPYLFTYLALAAGGLVLAVLVKKLVNPTGASPNWRSVIPATILFAIGASLFLPLKYAIPKIVPFWLDVPLAKGELALFGTHPWLVLDQMLGWAARPIDRLYGLWLPTQLLLFFTVMIQPGSPKKSRAIVAYTLAWFLLGMVGATILSSAGPIFHDRIFGGSAFAGLGATLRARGAWVVLAESESMWTALASGQPGLAAGISAAPSIHVAISVWIFLAAREMAPRASPFALIYAIFVWAASVQLGWHYVFDGLVGTLGMCAVWKISETSRWQRSSPGSYPLRTLSTHQDA